MNRPHEWALLGHPSTGAKSTWLNADGSHKPVRIGPSPVALTSFPPLFTPPLI